MEHKEESYKDISIFQNIVEYLDNDRNRIEAHLKMRLGPGKAIYHIYVNNIFDRALEVVHRERQFATPSQINRALIFDDSADEENI